MPTVSIGLPVYNGEKLIARAIEALLAQSYTDFELVIADNRSTDSTAEICQKYAHADKRIRYFVNDNNIGAAKNHSRVFELSSGKYFKWAAHDDECFPTMLGRCMQVMEGAPSEVILVYPQSIIIDESSAKIGEYKRSIASDHNAPHRRLAVVLRNLELGTPMYGVMRTNALRRTRLIDAFFSSDYVLFAELAMLGKIREVPEMLFKKRFHPGRSFQAHTDMESYLQWLDPDKRGGSFLAGTLPFEYLRSIWRLPLRNAERVLCTVWALAEYYRRQNINRGERWKNRFRRLCRIRPSASRPANPKSPETLSC